MRSNSMQQELGSKSFALFTRVRFPRASTSLGHPSIPCIVLSNPIGTSPQIHGGSAMFISRASCSAASLLARIFFWKAARALADESDGPRSSSSRGGGLSKSMSCIRVALENITYKCNHQTSSLTPDLPFFCMRSQSIVTPVRIV